MRFRPLLTAFFASMITACSGGSQLSDTRFPTGSQIMATSSDYQALYVAHADHGTIGRAPVAGGAIKSFDVGKRPNRVARAGNKLFVTLGGERKVAVMEERGEELVQIGSIDVGAEPYGVVASDDGARVYVTVSLDNRVVEIDGSSNEILRSWSIAGQPRWLALHPSGESLYVGSAMEGRLTWINLTANQVSEIALPIPQNSFLPDGSVVPVSRRLTGDMAVSANGGYLAAPGIVVNNNDVVPDGDDPSKGDEVPFPQGGGYDSGRFNPVVVVVDLEGDGQPVVDTLELVRVTANTPNGASIVGYPSSVSIDPSSEVAIATIEGAGAAVAFELHVDRPDQGVFSKGVGNAAEDIAIAPGIPDGRGSFGSFSFRNLQVIGVPVGPRSVLFADAAKPTVYSFIDRMTAKIDINEIKSRLAAQREASEGNGDAPIGFGEARAAPEPGPGIGIDPFVPPSPEFDLVASDRVEIVDEVLTDIEAKGRRLFFATNESKMSSAGSGVSCATCHFDGRNDGLSWNFARGLRQTPSLAGKVSLNAPVRWEGDSPTVAHDAKRTSQGLMGGVGMQDDDAQAIEAFIDTNPEINAPVLMTDAAALRGRVIFERPDVACASCHNGPRFTDKQKYMMKGLGTVQTRSLVGIAASGPYLHDGRAQTLLDVIKQSRDGSMGNTGMLSNAEMDDLVAYLKSI